MVINLIVKIMSPLLVLPQGSRAVVAKIHRGFHWCGLYPGYRSLSSTRWNRDASTFDTSRKNDRVGSARIDDRL